MANKLNHQQNSLFLNASNCFFFKTSNVNFVFLLNKVCALSPKIKNPLFFGAVAYVLPKLINKIFPKEEDNYLASRKRYLIRNVFSTCTCWTLSQSYNLLGKTFSPFFPKKSNFPAQDRQIIQSDSNDYHWQGEFQENLYIIRATIRDIFEDIKKRNKEHVKRIFKVVIPDNLCLMAFFMSLAFEDLRSKYGHRPPATVFELTILTAYGVCVGMTIHYIRKVSFKLTAPIYNRLPSPLDSWLERSFKYIRPSDYQG